MNWLHRSSSAHTFVRGLTRRALCQRQIQQRKSQAGSAFLWPTSSWGRKASHRTLGNHRPWSCSAPKAPVRPCERGPSPNAASRPLSGAPDTCLRVRPRLLPPRALEYPPPPSEPKSTPPLPASPSPRRHLPTCTILSPVPVAAPDPGTAQFEGITQTRSSTKHLENTQ